MSEHILTPIPGSTSLQCSCGNKYGTTDEAQQHRQWQLELAARTQDRIVAVLEGLRRQSGCHDQLNFTYCVSLLAIDSTINQVKEGKL